VTGLDVTGLGGGVWSLAEDSTLDAKIVADAVGHWQVPSLQLFGVRLERYEQTRARSVDRA
jgi:hypothetical protein